MGEPKEPRNLASNGSSAAPPVTEQCQMPAGVRRSLGALRRLIECADVPESDLYGVLNICFWFEGFLAQV